MHIEHNNTFDKEYQNSLIAKDPYKQKALMNKVTMNNTSIVMWDVGSMY